MKHRIIPAIMSGGAGTRLWPVSTDAAPKQFHAMGGPASLFTETVRRMSGDAGGLSFASPIVLANAAQADLVKTHLESAAATVVLEPIGRNTAPLGAIAALLGAEIEPDALVLLAPADHVIADRAAFMAAIEAAAPVARERIVTFGITPDRPETGYGYIKSGPQLTPGVFEIAAFREKPQVATAATYLAEGGYSWNAGLFLFSPRVMLEEFAAHAAAISNGARDSLTKATRRGAEIALDATAFAALPSEPLDIAIMEKTKRAAVAPCDIGWADLGAWSEVWRLADKDAAGNVLSGAAIALDSENALLSGDGITVCAAGVRDLIIIATRDAVIVLPRERAQDVKALREAALKLAREAKT